MAKMSALIKNYLVYPCEIMRITQNYSGKTSHLPHTTGSPKDYPFDEACKDSGQNWLHCPCDEMVVKRIYGVGNGGTNTIWLESTSVVYFADGTKNYFTMLITHPNDSSLRDIRVGYKFARGEKICLEGKDGATANHLHISGGKGRFKGNGWVANSKGKYVLTTSVGTYKPEKLFYIDTKFTTVISKGNIAFKTLSAAAYQTKKTDTNKSKAGYETGNYKVKIDKGSVLRVRTGAGTAYPYKLYSQLTKSAQNKIYKCTGGVKKHGYVDGLTFTVTEVKKNWGKTPSGWVCLDYCEKI